VLLDFAATLVEGIPGFAAAFRPEVHYTAAGVRGGGDGGRGGRRADAPGVAALREALTAGAPAGKWAYPAPPPCTTGWSGLTERERVEHVLWEKLIHRLHEELPYQVELVCEGWSDGRGGGERGGAPGGAPGILLRHELLEADAGAAAGAGAGAGGEPTDPPAPVCAKYAIRVVAKSHGSSYLCGHGSSQAPRFGPRGGCLWLLLPPTPS